MPAFGRFISTTGSAPLGKSPIDYFTPINQSITEYPTEQELWRQWEVATAEAAEWENGQQNVLNEIDLGGCIKALPLKWRFSETNNKAIIILYDPFHTPRGRNLTSTSGSSLSDFI